MKRKIDFFCEQRPAKIPRLEKDSETSLEPFKVAEHYSVCRDEFLDRGFIAVPTYKGSLLIAQYYGEKYGANLVLPASGHSKSSAEIFYEQPDVFLFDARKNNTCRQAFLLNMDSNKHATPVVYFKRNGQEGLLIADSLGTSEAKLLAAKRIYKNTGIPVYLIKSPRQADDFSCYLDALLVGIKCTAMNEGEEYLIPDLDNYFRKHALPIEEDVEGVFSTKLPDELLTTCQISTFLEFNQERDSKRAIHKNETLSMFRERYTQDMLIRPEKESLITEHRNVYSYPRIKSFKFVDIMIIQFYLSQLQKNGRTLLKEEQTDFIHEVKAILQSLDDFECKTENLLKLTEQYLTSPSKNTCSL